MSANKSLAYNVKPKYGVAGSAVAATNGASIDTAGYDEACVVASAGAIGASATLDVKIQDSADNSSWADVTGAVFTQWGGSDDNTAKIGMLKLNGNTVRRYIRCVGTVAGTGAADYGVSVLLVNGHYHPDQTPAFNV